MKSEQSQAAAQIRKHLKSKGIKANVTSDSASMITSVRVVIYNQSPAVAKEVKDNIQETRQ